MDINATSPERCSECPHRNYCPHFTDLEDGYDYDYCDSEFEPEEYEYGYDVRDGDAWGGFTGRSGG